MNRNAYDNYLKQEVEGASQGRLIVMMYDACVKFMNRAKIAIQEKDIEEAHNNLIRTESIIYELMTTLDKEKGGEVAVSLMRLYDFMIEHLIDANTSKDINKIDEVLKLIMPLRSAWREIVDREEKPVMSKGMEQVASKPINFAG